MADKGNQSVAGTDEERQREATNQGGHASQERGADHEFNVDDAAEPNRKGAHARAMTQANSESAGSDQASEGEESEGGSQGASEDRPKRTRGGTHVQHVTAGKKGGSRIRQLIELGYKYEQEHGIGPGQNERSKLAAKRRGAKGGGGEEEGGS
jgi:hypothetical protein